MCKGRDKLILNCGSWTLKMIHPIHAVCQSSPHSFSGVKVSILVVTTCVFCLDLTAMGGLISPCRLRKYRKGINSCDQKIIRMIKWSCCLIVPRFWTFLDRSRGKGRSVHTLDLLFFVGLQISYVRREKSFPQRPDFQTFSCWNFIAVKRYYLSEACFSANIMLCIVLLTIGKKGRDKVRLGDVHKLDCHVQKTWSLKATNRANRRRLQNWFTNTCEGVSLMIHTHFAISLELRLQSWPGSAVS